jgi:hypothetical protein
VARQAVPHLPDVGLRVRVQDEADAIGHACVPLCVGSVVSRRVGACPQAMPSHPRSCGPRPHVEGVARVRETAAPYGPKCRPLSYKHAPTWLGRLLCPSIGKGRSWPLHEHWQPNAKLHICAVKRGLERVVCFPKPLDFRHSHTLTCPRGKGVWARFSTFPPSEW